MWGLSGDGLRNVVPHSRQLWGGFVVPDDARPCRPVVPDVEGPSSLWNPPLKGSPGGAEKELWNPPLKGSPGGAEEEEL